MSFAHPRSSTCKRTRSISIQNMFRMLTYAHSTVGRRKPLVFTQNYKFIHHSGGQIKTTIVLPGECAFFAIVAIRYRRRRSPPSRLPWGPEETGAGHGGAAAAVREAPVLAGYVNSRRPTKGRRTSPRLLIAYKSKA